MKGKLKSAVHYFTKYQFFRFALIGGVNTVINLILIFTFYNVFHMGYWLSSGAGYVLVTFLSYYLNRKYTFRFHGAGLGTLIRFFAVIGCSYWLSYFVAKPLTGYALGWMFGEARIYIVEQAAMLVGMAGCMVFNYLCQRKLVFVGSGQGKAMEQGQGEERKEVSAENGR